MPLPRAGHPTARAVKASAPLKTAARRPCVVVVVVVVVATTPNYLRQASQNLGKYHSTLQWGMLHTAAERETATEGDSFSRLTDTAPLRKRKEAKEKGLSEPDSLWS